MIDEDLRRSVAHVVVAPSALDDGTTIGEVDRHHLARVLRLRRGELVTITDGAGRWRRCRWCLDGSAGGPQVLEPDGPIRWEPAPLAPLTIGFAPVKGDRPEWTVAKLTEVGIDRIVILRTARSVVRWDGDRAVAQLDRLGRVTREAAMQARRCYLPEIVGISAVGDLDGAMADFGGGPMSLAHPVVLIGPEGGWTDHELEGATARVSLGPLVLRAETAAVAAAVLLSDLRLRAMVTQSGRLS